MDKLLPMIRISNETSGDAEFNASQFATPMFEVRPGAEFGLPLRHGEGSEDTAKLGNLP